MKIYSLRDIPTRSPAAWAIKGVVGGLTVLWGPSGSYKTFLSISMSVAVAGGVPWYGSPVLKGGGTVLYILGEGGLDLFRRRAVEAARVLRVNPDTLPIFIVPIALDLSSPRKAATYFDDMAGVAPDLIVIDTLSRCMPGDENSQEVMQGFVNAMDYLRDTFSCSVLVVHHEGYSKGHERGSSVLPGAVDVSIRVRREREGVISLTPHKLRDMDTESFMHPTMNPTQVVVRTPDKKSVLDDFGDQVTTVVLHEPPIWEERVVAAVSEFTSLKSSRGDEECVGYKEWFEACGHTAVDFKKVLMNVLNNVKKYSIEAVDVGHYNYSKFITEGGNPFKNRISYGKNYDTEEQEQLDIEWEKSQKE